MDWLSFAEFEYIAASGHMMLVGSAGANVPMQCIGFQNGRRYVDEKIWDHDSTTFDPLNIF